MDTITIKPAEVLVVKVTPVVSGGTVEGGGGASDIGDLTSVTITSPQNGDVLVYNGSSWVNTSGIATESYVGTQISSVQSQVASNDLEISALQSSVAANETSISSLESADDTLQQNIDTEVANRSAADITLQDNIDAEESRALTAEGILQDNIDAEESRAMGVEADLQSELDATQAGAGLAANGDYNANSGTNYIDAATSLDDADDILDAALKTEEARAMGVEAALQNNIDALSLDSLSDVDLSTSPSDNQVLTYDNTSSSWKAEDAQVSSGTGTNLSASYTANYITIASSTGSDVTLSAASSNSAGVMLAADKSTIDNLAAVATSGDYSNLSGTPTSLSDFTNDPGYITGYTVTQGDVTQYEADLSIASSQVAGLAAVATTGTIESLSNTNISSVSDGQALVWDNNTSRWVNGTVASSGGLTAVSDDLSPSLGGELTAGEDINVSSGKVVRFGGSTSTFPSIGMDSALTKIDLDLGNYDFVINGDPSNSNLTINGSTLDINASTTTTNAFISTDTLSTGGFTATSANITGNITVSGTVDGRDVSDDGDKLDTLEFAADVNVTAIPTGGNQGNYAIVWDQSAQEWQSKIPTLPNLNYIDNVDTSGGTIDNGALLKWDDNNNEWRPSSFDGTGVITTDIADTKQALSNIEGILKTSTGTQLYNAENDQTKAYLTLGGTDSFFGVNNTGFNVEKNSPGTVTISVDAGPSPEASFDAFVVSGTTTAGIATTTISEGNTLTFDIGSNSATLTPSALTGDVDINLPSSGGTLALSSEIGGDNDITFNGTSGLVFPGGSSINLGTSNNREGLRLFSSPISSQEVVDLDLFSSTSGKVNINNGIYPAISIEAGVVTLKDGLTFESGSYKANISAPTLSSTIALTLPDTAGTLALTSDVPSSINDLTDTPSSLGTAGQVLAVNSGATATEWVTPSGGSGGASEVANETGTTRTLTSTDAGKYIVCTNASAITVNVNTGVFSVGDEILIEQGGAGQVTIAGTATVNTSSANTKKTAEQYAVIGLKCVAADTFTLTGERELA